MRHEEQSYRLTVADQQPRPTPEDQKKRIRHIYLEQENIYGRFVPYLLLKDQLESQIDSSGNTALHHMCSHNSPYLPLFLSSIPDGHPILNRRSKLGHTPLDVAGLYCTKEYIDMLKQKGALDNGNVDYWAIQGANPTNWSGKIYPQKKALIHWAAYNDMPEVIAEYAKQGVSVSEPDSNGYSPVDLTVLNKCYNSLRVLADLGQKPKPQLLKSTDSISIRELFQNKNEKPYMKKLQKYAKFFSINLFLSLCILLNVDNLNIGLTAINLAIIMYLLIKPSKVQKYLDNNRKTQFSSQLLLDKKINRNNHAAYLMLHFIVTVQGFMSVLAASITNHLIAFIAIFVSVYSFVYFVHLLVQLYGVCKNLTYDEIFYAHRWPHLWEKVKYIQQRKMVIRQFANMEDRGTWQNIKDYFIN